MYLTAQHVRSADGTAEGVNVVGYTHQGLDVPGSDWRQPNVALIAEHARGALMYVVPVVPVAPSPHNFVLSYLDVAVADIYHATTVASLLAAAPVRWNPTAPTPHIWSYGPLSLRLVVHPLLQGFPSLELRSLTDALLATLVGIPMPSPRAPRANHRRPLCIVRMSGKAAYQYALAAESKDIVRKLVGEGLPGSVNVTYETAGAFAAFHGGEIEPEIVRVLTRLSVEQIDAIGGVYIMNGPGGETIWRSVGDR